MKDKTTSGVDRRRFLATAGLGAAVAGTALAVTGKAAKAAPASVKRDGLGYQETDHVKRYYALARM